MMGGYEKWWTRLRFTLFFLVLTVVLHSFLGWFQGWLTPVNPYREPEGRALKVLGSGSVPEANPSPGNRLRLFYLLGE